MEGFCMNTNPTASAIPNSPRHNVTMRAKRRHWRSVALGLKCLKKSVVATVAIEFILELTVDIVAANKPAMTNPDNPAGNCWEMYQGKISSILPWGFNNAGLCLKNTHNAVPTLKKINVAGITRIALV